MSNDVKEALTVTLFVVFGWPISILPNQILQNRAKELGNLTFTDSEQASPTPVIIWKLLDYIKEHPNTDVEVVVAPPHRKRVMRDLKKMAEMAGVELSFSS